MRLRHDPGRNVLLFELAEGSGRWIEMPATIDVGEGGRLLGIEAPGLGDSPLGGPFYLAVSEAAGLSRSAAAQVRAEVDGDGRVLAIELARRGPGYEISWPSGNR
ncbi:MAG: hypothetical protein ACKOWF_07880 [Chloroflexota bacterium]